MERLCPTLTDAVLLQSHGCFQNKLAQKMAKVMGYIGNGGSDLGVTNLNKIDIQNVYERFVVEDILFVPPKVSYAKKVIGISTYADKLTVFIQGSVYTCGVLLFCTNYTIYGMDMLHGMGELATPSTTSNCPSPSFSVSRSPSQMGPGIKVEPFRVLVSVTRYRIRLPSAV